MPEEREDRPVALLRLVDDHHQDARSGHARLRQDINGLDKKVEDLQRAHVAHDTRLTTLELAPGPELSKLTLSWPTFVFVAVTILTAAGSQWALGASQRAGQDALASDVRNILTQMNARKDLDAAKEALQNERATNVAKTLEALDKQQKYLQSQIGDLTNAVLDLKRSR